MRSAVVMEFRCSECEHAGTVTLGPSLYHYELTDGSTLCLFHRQMWCTQCATIVNAEVLPDSAEIQGQLDVAIAGEANGPRDESRERVVEVLARALQWRVQRESPPRCLVCGTSRIASLEADGVDAAVHPGCGGEFQFQVGAYVTLGASGGKYSPEGLRLEMPSPFQRG
jgi:hypothetical protein